MPMVTLSKSMSRAAFGAWAVGSGRAWRTRCGGCGFMSVYSVPAPPHERPGTWRSAAGPGGRPAARRQLGFAAPQAAHASPMRWGPGGLWLKRRAVVCSRMRGGDPAALASLRGAAHSQMTWHHLVVHPATPFGRAETKRPATKVKARTSPRPVTFDPPTAFDG